MAYESDYRRQAERWMGGPEQGRRRSVTTDRFVGGETLRRGYGRGHRGYDYDAGYRGEWSPRGRNRGARMGLGLGQRGRGTRGEVWGGDRRYGGAGGYAIPDHLSNRASASYETDYFSAGPTYGVRGARFGRGYGR